ncbi:Heat shock protein 70, conserved site [Phytophthora cactorum]|nr:Heat shock protein 70, conserved site [Phytophthora cactorum]
MAFNKFAFGTIAMIIFATIYNIAAIILPTWSANKTVNSALTSEVSSTDFKAGLLGFCVDSELTNGTSFDHCFYYKFGSSYDDLSVLNTDVWSKYSSDGICKGYSNAGDVSDTEQLAYASILATAAGMDAEQFDKFLDKSCGLVGTATMAFGGMSLSNGVMAIIAMVGAITCCKGNKKWIGGGFFLAGVASFTAMLTFVLWVVQSKPLGKEDDASFKTSFFLMIIAMLHYPLAMFMFWKYLKLQQEVQKEVDEDHTTYTGAETPVSGVPASLQNLTLCTLKPSEAGGDCHSSLKAASEPSTYTSLCFVQRCQISSFFNLLHSDQQRSSLEHLGRLLSNFPTSNQSTNTHQVSTMAFNKFAFGAIAMIIFATIYNIAAIILPTWSANKTVNSALTSEVSSTDFKAGLLGFCVDSELTNGTSFDHCFYYKFGSSYDDLSVLNTDVWSKYSSDGICKGYSNAGDVSDTEQLAYASILATAAGMDAEQFDKFLDKSCGLVGTATMAFGGMSLSNGVMAIIAMVGAITCCKGNKKWIGGGFFLAGVASFTAMLTFVLWVVQSKPLGKEDDASFKTSFFLMIIAMLHYPLAMFMFWKYLKLQQEVQKEVDEDHTTYIGVETPNRNESICTTGFEDGQSSTKRQLTIIVVGVEEHGADDVVDNGFFISTSIANSTVNSALTSEIASTNFKAGLMSFCIDSEIANSTTTLDHCFYYKFGSGYEDLKVINETVWAKYSEYAPCEGYSKAGDVSDAERLAYATVLATAAGMDATQFDKFLDKSCGILGMGTMTFGGMSMSNGLMAIIAIVGAITCRQGNKKWVGGGFFLAGGGLHGHADVRLWMVQAGPLGEKDDTSLKTAYEDVLTSEADENGVSPYEFGVKMLQDNEHDGAQLGTAIKSRRTETEEKTLDDDSREPPCTMTGVRQAAELVKRQLTDASVTTAACVWKDSKKLVRAEVKVTRTQFEELCGSLLERTMIPVREVLEANNMDTDEIDAVVLVGGSSRIPWVRQRLTDMFQGRAPLSDIDPDLAVSVWSSAYTRLEDKRLRINRRYGHSFG